MKIKLLRNQRYIDIAGKIKIGTKGATVDAQKEFVEKYLSKDVYSVAEEEKSTTEKALDKMNWLELANKALEMQLIESVEKAQEDKLTKAQLIDIINGTNA